ncbi:MAG TPA: PP2C family protein-serine/threonine phosphatase [Planctomycetota bacterium]
MRSPRKDRPTARPIRLSPMESDEEEIVAQTKAYRITKRRSGDFLLFTVSGRCGDALLDDFRSKVFLYRCDYALDLSALTGANAALARELRDTAASFSSGQKRLVLIHPPEALASLLSMGGGKSPVEIVHAEDQLAASTPVADEAGANMLRQLERTRKEFQTNRYWQLVDREGYWICPYCAGVQTDVRVTSLMAVSSAVIERAYRHLWSKCPDFQPTAPRLRPLAELQEALRRANQEKTVVPTRQLDKMATEIAALKGRKEELEDSVRRASERQRRLLPAKAPDVPGAEIEIIYRPAAVVSGDFYDFVPLDDGKMAFLIGDVSGHGIEAGIVMGMAKKVLAIRLQDSQDLVDALVRTNADVDRELGRVSFVTVFVAVFDPAARTLSCVRAGHNPPLLFNPRREGRCLEIKPGGLGLGILGDPMFEPTIEQQEIAVEPGDILLLYTDGLVEARNAEGDQFGVERTIKVLGSTYGYTPALVLSQLASDLDGFTGKAESEDDISAVCVRFK